MEKKLLEKSGILSVRKSGNHAGVTTSLIIFDYTLVVWVNDSWVLFNTGRRSCTSGVSSPEPARSDHHQPEA